MAGTDRYAFKREGFSGLEIPAGAYFYFACQTSAAGRGFLLLWEIFRFPKSPEEKSSCGKKTHAAGAAKEESMKETKKWNKKVLAGVAALVAAIAVLAAVFFVFREKPVAGSKSVTIEVVNKAQETASYTVKTDAEYLRQAMEETEGLTFSGTESEYGMMVETVNGETADYNTDGAYWAFYVNGDYCNYGIDTQPVEDGDTFTIAYTVYVSE